MARHVMTVDDSKTMRVMVMFTLRGAGFQVSEAESVKTCLSYLGSHSADVIILDIVMPERDGIEAVQEIKRMSPASKIVTVSGARNSQTYLAASAYLGADASLDKSRIVSLCALLDVLLEATS